jgi:hypothetical protein
MKIKSFGFKKNKVLLAILSAGFISPGVALAQSSDMYHDDYSDIEFEEGVEYTYEDNTQSLPSNMTFNPFMNISSTIENMNLQRTEREAELDLVESEIELQRRQFEKEILPIQMEIERARIQEELYSIQSRNQAPTPPPSVTLRDIEDRIDVVAGQMLREQKEQIEKLESEKAERERRENTFNLRLISSNSSGLYAVISDGHGEEYRVREGEFANGWNVLGIDKDRMRVVVRKGNTTEVVSPSSESVSLISIGGSSSNSSDGSQTTVSDIPPPNF